MNFWDFIGFMFWTYVFFSYLMVLFRVIADIFRDTMLNGWIKAVWIVLLVFVPFLTALVYLIARGSGMAERQYAAVDQMRSQQDAYIRSVASNSPVDEITKAKALLDAGTISASEYNGLKARALGSVT